MIPGTRGQALAARAAAWYSALPGKRRELVQDGTLAIALAVLNMLSLLPYQSQMHPAWLALFLVSAQCAPLAIRRVNPVLALTACAVPRVLYDYLRFGFAPLPLGPAIAFATVADRSRPWLRWTTLASTGAGIAWAQTLPGHHQPYEAIVQYFIFGTAWAVGTLAHSRRTAIAEAAYRAERAEAELDALAAKAAAAAAAERARIARELHDVVAHHVSLMAVQAEAAGALLPSRPEQAAWSVDLIAGTARQAMTELRRLLGVLRGPPDSADQCDYPERAGLAPAASLSRLEEVLAQVRDAGVPVSLSVSGPAVALSPGIDLTAYRIVQEALTNTIRHAQGAQVCVEISYEEGSVTVRVTDTGPGVTPDGATSGAAPSGAGGQKTPARLGPGFGLAGIAERVSSCGGTLTVGPAATGGFAVTAQLPLR